MRQQNGRFYFTVFRSLPTNPTVNELLKSVHICQSYRKNKSCTIFMAHGVDRHGQTDGQAETDRQTHVISLARFAAPSLI